LPQTITVRNAEAAALTIQSIAVSSSYSQGNNCPLAPSTFAAGASCTISGVFSPVISGLVPGTLTVVYNDPTSPQTIGLSGTGLAGSASILTQPQNQEVPVSQPATFSVTATGVTSYQWQRNGTNISGATSSVYTIPATVPGDNGATFQVVLNGVLTSVAANLQVDTGSSIATATISAVATQPVQNDFGGISVDIFSENALMGNSTTGFNPVYRQLVKNLVFPGQTFVFNVEGDSPIAPIAPTQTQVLTFTQIYNDLLSSGTTTGFFLPGNMCANSPTNATAEETLYLANVPIAAYLGMALGNEPDGACRSTYGASYSAFKTKWDTFRTAVNVLAEVQERSFLLLA